MDIISSLSKPPAGWGWCLAAAFTVTLVRRLHAVLGG